MRNKRNGYIKIGYTSKDPVFREKTLQSEEPEIELIFSFYGLPMKEEKNLHKHFDDKRIRGEWFKLSELDIYKAKDFLKNKYIDKNKNKPFNDIEFDFIGMDEYESMLMKRILYCMYEDSSDLTTISDSVILAFDKDSTTVNKILRKIDNGLDSHYLPF